MAQISDSERALSVDSVRMASRTPWRVELRSRGGLEIRDTAGCNPALRALSVQGRLANK